MSNTIEMPRRRKSEKLTKDEHRAFIQYFKSFPTKVDAEEVTGIKRQVLDNVALKGSGSPETINALREILAERVRA